MTGEVSGSSPLLDNMLASPKLIQAPSGAFLSPNE